MRRSPARQPGLRQGRRRHRPIGGLPAAFGRFAGRFFSERPEEVAATQHLEEGWSNGWGRVPMTVRHEGHLAGLALALVLRMRRNNRAPVERRTLGPGNRAAHPRWWDCRDPHRHHRAQAGRRGAQSGRAAADGRNRIHLGRFRAVRPRRQVRVDEPQLPGVVPGTRRCPETGNELRNHGPHWRRARRMGHRGRHRGLYPWGHRTASRGRWVLGAAAQGTAAG